jgi:hypothetical protein
MGLDTGNSNPTRTTDSHLKRTICTNCCIHAVVPPDDGPRYGRNVYRLTKYTENKLCIELVFLYTIQPYCLYSFRDCTELKKNIVEGKNSHFCSYMYSKNIFSVSIFRRLRKIAKSDCQFLSCCSSICPSELNSSVPNERIFMKFDI